MKKTIFIVLISLCLYSFLHAETEKELFDKGVRLFKQGQYQQAIDKFSRLIELAPDNADAHKNRGVSYMKQEKFDLAIKDFQTAKELFPELKGLYSNLGVAWYYKKEYEKAIKNYDLEIEMAPENHVAYFNRALCLAELGKNKEALDNLSKTLNLKHDFYWAICYKADLLAEEGEDTRAVETYELAIRQNPKNTYATQRLAQLKKEIKENGTLEPLTENNESNKISNKGYTLQAGAFLNQTNANKMKTRLADNGFNSSVLILKDSKDRTWYLVRSGHYANQDEAKKAIQPLKDKLAVKSMIRPVGRW